MATRRTMLTAALALGACTPADGAQDGLVPTPAQMEGPYYPRPLPAETDADLTRVAGAPRAALGERLTLTGRALRADGAPLPGTVIEIWQTDAQGIYLHPRDPRVAQRDAGFQGYGRAQADAEGRYRFHTIRPAHYEGRTAHIHLRATPPGGAPLTTQLYFPDDPANARDGLLRRMQDPARRAALMVRLDRGGDGALLGAFDIVLR